MTQETVPDSLFEAMATLYYFSTAHARQLGCTEVGFRGPWPSPCDGFCYKRNWGNVSHNKTDTYYDLLLHWNSENGVVKDVLSRAGLTFRDEGPLSTIHPGEFQRRQSLWIGGLHRLYLLTESGCQPMMDEGASLGVAGSEPDSHEVNHGAR